MLATTEVRWFFEGPQPEDVAAWFAALGPPPEKQDPRTDNYLHPTDAALNVKVREGCVEVKRRDDTVGELVALADEQTGLIEHWRKWSFPLATEAPEPAPLDACWLPVRKHRWMRVYRVAKGTVDEITGTTDDAPRRCSVELSRLILEGQDWWSLCLEASGDERARSLYRTAAHIFSPPSAPPLYADASMGYAAWLLRTRR